MTDLSLSLLPITVITGFLGSGKTTLLNRLIAHPEAGQVAVIVNEFGEVGLDNLLIEPVTEDIVLLPSGCVCCTVRNDLMETLLDLAGRRQAGEMPPFMRVVVETTGLADPAPILHSLMVDPEITGHYYLDGIVATVDALEGEVELERYPESVKQVAMADRLILTKGDLANPEAVELLRERVKLINPAAVLLDAQSADLTPADLFNVGLMDGKTNRPDIAGWLGDSAYRDTPAQQLHNSAITSFCIYRNEPIERAVLGLWLNELMRDNGAHLLRVKGLVDVAGSSTPIVIHGVQHRLYPPAYLPRWPLTDRRSRIVFIVQGIEPGTLEASLEEITKRLRPGN